MNRKNRWIVVLTVILALMLTGCGSDKAPEKGTVVPATQPQTTAAPVETKPVQTEAAETEPVETEPPATEAETVPEENPLSLGRMEGGTYRNTYAGFACDLDSNWEFYSAEELQQLPSTTMEAIEGSELAELMANVSQLMDMQAENAAALATVNVLYSKQDMATTLAYRLLTDEEIIDATLEQKDIMMAGYAQAGMNVESMEKVQVTFLGKDAWGIKTVCQIDAGDGQTVPYYILQVFNYRCGAYGVTITCGTFLEDNTQDVLDLFYPVN